MLLAVLFVLCLTQKTFASTESAKSFCVMNSVTGEIVAEKNSDTRLPMASTTKIITLMVVLENARPEDVVTVSKNAVLEEGSSAYLKPDAKITVRDLCYGLMLNSGNDAAVALAEHISGSTDAFAILMNDKVREIGAKNTNLKNPNGLHDEKHYTTASDMAKLTRYALKNDKFREIVSARSYTSSMLMPDGKTENVEYINHNRLLVELDGCIGVKTGFTKTAGRCLVSAVNRNGAEYIIVTLNDSDDWNTHKELYSEAFKTNRERKIVRKGDVIKHAVFGKEECALVAKEDFSVFVNKNGNQFEIVKSIPQTVDFPLNKGEKTGYIEIRANGETVGVIDVVAEHDFNPQGEAKVKNCFMFTFINILRNFI